MQLIIDTADVDVGPVGRGLAAQRVAGRSLRLELQDRYEPAECNPVEAVLADLDALTLAGVSGGIAMLQ